MRLDNKKVLALPFGEYFSVFQKIFTFGKKEYQWDVRCVSSSLSVEPYKAFIDSLEQIYQPVNLSEKQPWETDKAEWDKIQNLMVEAEKCVKIPLNRLLLSSERSAGRAYSKSHYHWPEGFVARSAMKNKEICNKMLVRAFKFAFDVIQDFKPEFCLGAQPCGLVSGVFYCLLKYYDIPYISCALSMLMPNKHFWTTNWGSFNTDVELAFHKKLVNQEKPTLKSLEYVQSFRKTPEPMPYYKKAWSDKKLKLSFFNIHRRIAFNLMLKLITIIKREKLENPVSFFQMILFDYRRYFLKKFQRKFYKKFSDSELSKIKYIYYPMHQEPEFVLNVQAPAWHNQLNTIKQLSLNLPTGYRLLVREHRNNIGRKSLAYLKEMSRYPGVVIVDAFDDQYKYISNASLVVTVNGSTGLEGMLLRRPVLTLDKTSYDALGLNFKLTNELDLGRVILLALNQNKLSEKYDNTLALFLDAENEVSFDVDADSRVEIDYIAKMLSMSPTKMSTEFV